MKTAIKVGSRESFFQNAKERLIKLESGEKIDSTRQIVFEDAGDLINFLGTARLSVFRAIRDSRNATYKSLEIVTRRKRDALRKDIRALEKIGLVKHIQTTNPGHGRQIVFLPGVDGPVKIEAIV